MQRTLRASSVLVLIVGVQLFVLSAHTNVAFAFPIEPPITAAFLGANYWGSVVLEYLASREETWANARAAVPGVLVFTALTLVQTVGNLAFFRLESPFAWTWIAVYAIAPCVFGWLWWKQRQVEGGEPARGRPLPVWIRATLMIHTVVLLTIGAALFFGSETVTDWWPWQLDLHGKYKSGFGPYVGCWLVGVGAIAGQAAWENDLRRLRGALPSLALLGALQLVTLARYRHAFGWASVSGRVFVTLVVPAVVAGVAGTVASRAADV
ncbi:MAG: hypothetical protein ACHREM_10310 [Polyangiales bacterium]